MSCVDGASFDCGAGQIGIGNARSFEVRLPVAGRTSRFQWRFFGVLVGDGSAALVQGAFRLPRFVTVYFVTWLIAAGLFVASTILVAANAAMPAMWLLPLAGVVVIAASFLTLFVGRAMAEEAMQKAASQLDRCLG